ncbi:MAG: hypothetical protein ABSC19_02165 [Syntrophorhabdales bacterium]
MSDISGISNSLTSSLLSSLESSGTASSTAAASDAAGTDSDIVSLLGGSSSNSDSSLYSALTGSSGSQSTDPMYSILLSAESASLMKTDPGILSGIIAADQAPTASGTSSSGSTGTESLVQALQNINLLTVNPDTLLSIIKDSSSGGASTVSTTA